VIDIRHGMMKPNVIVRPIMLLIFSFDIVLMFVCYIYIICYWKYFVCNMWIVFSECEL